MIAAEALRAVSIDLSRRCQAGDFGHRHSLLRARMDAHAATLWAAADGIDIHRISPREIEGYSLAHRLRRFVLVLFSQYRGARR